MFPPIFAVCAADAEVLTVLGANPVRLFPFGEAPQNVTAPYAVWQVISGQPENFISDRPDIDEFTLQVDVYGNTDTEVTAAAIAIRNAVELQANIGSWGGQNKDPTTGRYRIRFDIDWLTPR
ncbi:DUF3168 domain-containing protein [Marinobacter sp. 1Y8]